MSETINKELIRNAFAVRYPQFPVTVQESPDDAFVLCVRVFAVPSETVKEVKAYIRQLEQEILHGSDHVLLPMVKNLQVTQEYYPEYSQSLPTITIDHFVSQLLTTAVYQSVYSEAQPQLIPSAFAPELRKNVRFTPNIGRDYLQHRESDLRNTVANEELALAA